MSLPDEKEFSLSRLSFRRNANQTILLMMLIILLGIVGAALSQCSFNGVQRALNNDLDDLH